MTYEFRPAVRTNTKPLIGLYGLSGSGKTYSALMLARGLVGDAGKIAMIDTESGRGSIYADVIPGGYDVLQLGAPFAPENYIQAIEAAEQSGAGCLIIDSASHEWEGLGGVLAMAGAIEESSGKAGLHCWNKPKQQHSRFVLKLLQSTLPVIVCLRAKHKSRQTRQNGKTVIIKDEHASPIQSEEFIYEMTVHAEVLADHSLNVTKCSHPDLQPVFNGAAITIETGRALAAWTQGGSQPEPVVYRITASDGRVIDINSAESWREKMQAGFMRCETPEAVNKALDRNKQNIADAREHDSEAANAVVGMANARIRILKTGTE